MPVIEGAVVQHSVHDVGSVLFPMDGFIVGVPENSAGDLHDDAKKGQKYGFF